MSKNKEIKLSSIGNIIALISLALAMLGGRFVSPYLYASLVATCFIIKTNNYIKWKEDFKEKLKEKK